jgi:hypothetical protein
MPKHTKRKAAYEAVHPETKHGGVPGRLKKQTKKGGFSGYLKGSAGQDFSTLSRFGDYLSPMCYAHMLERPPRWVHSVVVRLAEESAAPILPSIQVGEAYRPGVAFSAEEFEEELREALKPPSRGVVLWSWEALAKDPEKRRVVREVLAER